METQIRKMKESMSSAFRDPSARLIGDVLKRDHEMRAALSPALDKIASDMSAVRQILKAAPHAAGSSRPPFRVPEIRIPTNPIMRRIAALTR